MFMCTSVQSARVTPTIIAFFCLSTLAAMKAMKKAKEDNAPEKKKAKFSVSNGRPLKPKVREFCESHAGDGGRLFKLYNTNALWHDRLRKQYDAGAMDENEFEMAQTNRASLLDDMEGFYAGYQVHEVQALVATKRSAKKIELAMEKNREMNRNFNRVGEKPALPTKEPIAFVSELCHYLHCRSVVS